MIHSDTIKLLRECNSGIKMGVASIDEALPSVDDENLKRILEESKREHVKLGKETAAMLEEYGDDSKEPGPVAKGMSWLATNAKLALKPGDGTVADLITDGCNMGVKSLSRYLNQYEAAEERAKDIAKRLINLEEKLSVDIRPYL
jgi:formiminotetrahydrofolate cyclodeaminase